MNEGLPTQESNESNFLELFKEIPDTEKRDILPFAESLAEDVVAKLEVRHLDEQAA
jgi:hypothetical protein